MKTSGIKKIANSIIPRLNNSYWDFYQDTLIIKPVNELLRGICFNKSGLSKSQFELRYFVQPLYVPLNFVNLSFGGFIRTPNNRQWWEYDNEILEQLSNTMSSLVNQVDSTFLSQVRNAEKFYEFYKDERKNSIRHFEAVAYSAAYSEQKTANEMLLDFLSFLGKKEEKNFDWVKEIYTNTEKLLEGNRKDILNKWEMQTRTALKL